MLVDNHVRLFRQPYRLETMEECLAAARSRGVAEIVFVEHCTAFRSWWEGLDGWWLGRGTAATENYYANTFWPTQGYRDPDDPRQNALYDEPMTGGYSAIPRQMRINSR